MPGTIMREATHVHRRVAHAAADPLDLADSGRTRYAIVIARNADYGEEKAAEEVVGKKRKRGKRKRIKEMAKMMATMNMNNMKRL